MQKFLEMNLDAPGMRAADWGMALASIAVGAWLGSWLWIAAGSVGAWAAWYRPLTRMQNMARRIVVRRAAG